MTLTYTNKDTSGEVINRHEINVTPKTYEQTIKQLYGLADLGWKVRTSGNKVYCTLKDNDGKVQYVFTK